MAGKPYPAPTVLLVRNLKAEAHRSLRGVMAAAAIHVRAIRNVKDQGVTAGIHRTCRGRSWIHSGIQSERPAKDSRIADHAAVFYRHSRSGRG